MTGETVQPVKLYSTSATPENFTDDEAKRAPIILIHGMTDQHVTWNKVMFDLCEKTRRKVYAIDCRNHGRSEWSDEDTLEQSVADLELFLQTKGLDKVILIAHSRGGRIGMDFALTKPELVEKLVIEDCSLTDPKGDTERNVFLYMGQVVQDKVENLPSSLSESQAQKLIKRMVTDILSTDTIGYKLSEVPMRIPMHKTPSGKFVWEINSKALERGVEKYEHWNMDMSKKGSYDGDTLFLVAGKSNFNTMSEEEQIRKHFPKVEFIIFEKANHNIHAEDPKTFLEKVVNFLNKR